MLGKRLTCFGIEAFQNLNIKLFCITEVLPLNISGQYDSVILAESQWIFKGVIMSLYDQYSKNVPGNVSDHGNDRQLINMKIM